MNIEEVREYCISQKGVTEGFPFDNDTLVFKVMDKIFALLSLEKHHMNLKCDPENAIILRSKYTDVVPGYHMNKKYWNTINLESTIPREKIIEWIDESYALVVKGLPVKKREQLNIMSK